MGLNRMMMKGSAPKDIEAKMLVGSIDTCLGYMSDFNVGTIEPNPLPNGVRVSTCAVSDSNTLLLPNSIKSCTLVEPNIDIKHDEPPSIDVLQYLLYHVGSEVPVIFHF